MRNPAVGVPTLGNSTSLPQLTPAGSVVVDVLVVVVVVLEVVDVDVVVVAVALIGAHTVQTLPAPMGVPPIAVQVAASRERRGRTVAPGALTQQTTAVCLPQVDLAAQRSAARDISPGHCALARCTRQRMYCPWVGKRRAHQERTDSSEG
jgi:hypothetical protein